MRLAIFFNRQKLVENAVLCKQQHAHIVGRLLCGKESFARVVYFEVIDLTAEYFIKLLPVRHKRNSAVDVQFKIWPNLFDGGFTFDFQNTLKQEQGPGRNACE